MIVSSTMIALGNVLTHTSIIVYNVSNNKISMSYISSRFAAFISAIN